MFVGLELYGVSPAHQKITRPSQLVAGCVLLALCCILLMFLFVFTERVWLAGNPGSCKCGVTPSRLLALLIQSRAHFEPSV